jgi:phage terminase large subunit
MSSNPLVGLSGLPPKQVLALALAEKARREKLKQEATPQSPVRPELKQQGSLIHDPDHPYYDILHGMCVDTDTGILVPYRNLILEGGRGSAKSWSVAEAFVELASAQPILVVCGREYQTSIKDSVHKLLKDTISRLGLSSWFTITNDSIRSRVGAEFIFKGFHNNVEQVIKSTEGADYLWVEEGQSVAKQSWKYIYPTIRKPGSKVIITMNRSEDTDATVTEFIDDPYPRTIHHHVNYDQNPFFSQELEEARMRDYNRILKATNDDERKQAQSDYDHTWLGLAKTLNNEVIFAGKYVVEAFDDQLYKKANRLLFGLDFGFSQDPTACNRMFILDDCLYIEYEAHGTNLDFAGNMSADGRGELEQALDTIPGIREWPIKADGARPETISFLRGKGFHVSPADKWPGSVEDGITHIRGFRKVVIHPRCKYTILEFKAYKYKVDRITQEVLPIIIDKNNHHIDDIRYGLDGYIQRRGDLGIWSKLGGG